ncbi:hypothetical protein AG1IA_08007 [Rhizoctonia solani AG-1 IA]|uniref:Uncharacterized protein n=1 Tax=Thanatephorus cucumeris (strain AG1-IA) TaxID=983506 RepID=L8WJ58_THACA|nr:hypothetical protein AG1IA_08007 [Rhizoctonia solani AG-1 IA]
MDVKSNRTPLCRPLEDTLSPVLSSGVSENSQLEEFGSVSIKRGISAIVSMRCYEPILDGELNEILNVRSYNMLWPTHWRQPGTVGGQRYTSNIRYQYAQIHHWKFYKDT